MLLINCEITLILTWSENCVSNQNFTFEITEAKLYVTIVTLSTQYNAKLLPQLKSDFKRTTNWNNCLSKSKLLAQNPIWITSLSHILKELIYFSF